MYLTQVPPRPSLARRTLHGAVWSLGAQAVTALASLLAFALLGRMVGHAELGEYMLALVGVGAVQWLALNAWREPLIQAPTLGKTTCDSVFWFSLGVGGLLAVILLGAAGYLHWQGHMHIVAACLPFLAAKVFFDTLSSVSMALASRELRFPLLARVSMVVSVLGSVLSISLLYAGYGVQAVAASQGASSALSFVLLLLSGNWRPALHFSWPDLAPLRSYSPHVILWQGVEALNLYLDRFLAGVRLSPQALGVYGFGRRLNDIVIEVLVGAVGNVALPAYATLQADRAALRKAFIRSMRIMSFAVFPVIGILFGMADDLVNAVFGNTWDAAVPIYRCFLLLGAIQTIGVFQAALIRSLGFANLWARYQLLQAVANIVVLMLVIDHGIFALAVAVVVRTTLIWSLAVRMTCRLIEMPVHEYLALFVRPLLGAVLAGFAAAGVLSLMQGTWIWLAMAVAMLAGVLAYLLATLLSMRPVADDVLNLMTAHRA